MNRILAFSSCFSQGLCWYFGAFLGLRCLLAMEDVCVSGVGGMLAMAWHLHILHVNLLVDFWDVPRDFLNEGV